MSLVESGVSIEQRFDGARNVAVFKYQVDGQVREVTTNKLGQAVQRVTYRTGTLSQGKGGGIADEPSYNIVHPVLDLSMSQMESILNETARAMGVTRDQSIDVVASRNYLGAYTDQGGGIKRGDWTMAPAGLTPKR